MRDEADLDPRSKLRRTREGLHGTGVSRILQRNDLPGSVHSPCGSTPTRMQPFIVAPPTGEERRKPPCVTPAPSRSNVQMWRCQGR